jgi:hypothetical protein
MAKNQQAGLRQSMKASREDSLTGDGVFSLATLDLRFARQKTLDPRVTFTRASSGTYVGSDGLIQTAVTNLLLRSEEFDSASWTKTRSSVTANAITAPNGTLTADELVEDTTVTNSHNIGQSLSFTSGTTYTISVFAKATASPRFLQIIFPSGAFTASRRPVFDLLNGIALAATDTTATIQNIGNGWYRCVASMLSTNTNSASIFFQLADTYTNSAPNYTGNGVSGVYLWGAQVEVGSAVTPYIQSPSVFTSRASSGTYVGGNGLIQTAVTNLLLRSEEFDDASWSVKTNLSVSANAVTAPNGTLTADKLVENSANAEHFIPQTVSGLNLANVHTFSVYLKSAERSHARIRLGASGNFVDVVIDLSTGGLDTPGTGGTGSAPIANATSVGDGWFRVSISGTNLGASGQLVARVDIHNGTTTSYQGDGTSGVYIWGAQLEQASTVGEYIPTTSTINSAARYDHDPISLIGKGLLLEEASTNLFLQSENFDATWIQNGITVSTDVEQSPTGTLTADKIKETSATAFHLAQQVAAVIGTAYTASVYLKAAERSFALFSNGIYHAISIDLTAGTVTNALGSTTQSIQALSGGWYRVSFTFTAAATNVNLYSSIDGVWANRVYAGTTGSGIYAWGAQLEAGAFATSYIPTTTATVTRAADISTSVATSVFESSWYNQTEGTNLIEFRETDRTGTRTPRSLSDGTASNRIDAFLSSSLTVNNRLVLAGVSYNPGNLTLSAAGTVNKHVASAAPGSAIAVTNGTLSTESAPPSLPVVNRIVIGADSIGGTPFTGAIRRITYWPTRLGNEVLQRITQ